MSYVIEKPYVYVVLEHAYMNHTINGVPVEHDCVLHGVYTDKHMARGKRMAIMQKACDDFAGSPKLKGNVFSSGCVGHISILKKPINGKIRKDNYDFLNNINWARYY